MKIINVALLFLIMLSACSSFSGSRDQGDLSAPQKLLNELKAFDERDANEFLNLLEDLLEGSNNDVTLVSSLYERSDAVAYVKVVEASLLLPQEDNCGVRYSAKVNHIFKGEAQLPSVIDMVFSYELKVGRNYLAFFSNPENHSKIFEEKNYEKGSPDDRMRKFMLDLNERCKERFSGAWSFLRFDNSDDLAVFQISRAVEADLKPAILLPKKIRLSDEVEYINDLELVSFKHYVKLKSVTAYLHSLLYNELKNTGDCMVPGSDIDGDSGHYIQCSTSARDLNIEQGGHD